MAKANNVTVRLDTLATEVAALRGAVTEQSGLIREVVAGMSRIAAAGAQAAVTEHHDRKADRVDERKARRRNTMWFAVGSIGTLLGVGVTWFGLVKH